MITCTECGIMFHVVNFTDTKEVDIIPSSWLHGQDQASWPPYTAAARITAAVHNREVPGDSWKVFAIKILYSSIIEINTKFV